VPFIQRHGSLVNFFWGGRLDDTFPFVLA